MQLTIDVPEKYLVGCSSEEFIQILKTNTAIDLYRNGRISITSAIELIGNIDRYEFLYECKKRGIEPQTYENAEELESEVTMLEKDMA